MKLSVGAERYLARLRAQPDMSEQTVAEIVNRAEALAAMNEHEYVTSWGLAQARQEIRPRRAAGRRKKR